MNPTIPIWKIFIVLIVLPGCYVLYSLTPWSVELFSKSNNNYFILFFSGLTTLHWLSFFICYRLLVSSGWKIENIGLALSFKELQKRLVFYAIIGIGLLVFVEVLIINQGLDAEKINRIGDFFPKTTGQRTLFVITAISAGFCEEFVFRGFGIRALESRSVNTWVALLITSFSFTFVHGIVVLDRFLAYFIPGIIFGLLFIWRNSLTLSITIHVLIDLGAILMILQAL